MISAFFLARARIVVCVIIMAIAVGEVGDMFVRKTSSVLVRFKVIVIRSVYTRGLHTTVYSTCAYSWTTSHAHSFPFQHIVSIFILISSHIDLRHSIVSYLRRYHVYVHGYTSPIIPFRTMDLSKSYRQKLSNVTVLLIVSQRSNHLVNKEFGAHLVVCLYTFDPELWLQKQDWHCRGDR